MTTRDVIAPDVTLARLLEIYPALLTTLVTFHPHFARIENRLRRRMTAPRVTLEQAAAIAGVPVHVLVRTLRRAAGLQDDVPAAFAGAITSRAERN